MLSIFFKGHRSSRMEGFTLIELMIVVAIVSLLVAIAIPTFNEYRRHAADTMAQADAKSTIQVFISLKI